MTLIREPLLDHNAGSSDPPALINVGRAVDEAIDVAALQNKVANLETALQSSRHIGIAIGIVMERCRVSNSEAFKLLVHVSQNEHRKLRDIADDLVFTGVVPVSP